jgi:hypothetical protein
LRKAGQDDLSRLFVFQNCVQETLAEDRAKDLPLQSPRMSTILYFFA